MNKGNRGTTVGFDYESFEEDAIEALKSGKPLTGKDGIITPLIKRILEAALEGEIEVHLAESDVPNRRNGKATKTVQSSHGPVEVTTPRDREGSFTPQIVRKRQTVLNESVDHKILALFGLGMSYADISEHLAEMYGLDVSSATITSVTDKLLPEITEWRGRPLDSVYPIMFMDAMFFKVRQDGRVRTQVLYTIMGINMAGRKDILGLYVGHKEGANFWLSVLNDLKERGIEDILIACVDGLKGFPEAINTIFPQTEIQLCIVHQIRNSLRYVVHKDQKAFMADLKQVYKAPSREVAENKLSELDDKWGNLYPVVIKSWRSNWDNLCHYFQYPEQIRRVIYTTNILESFHRQVTKVTKTKGAFTSENALMKLVYCASQRAMEKWTMAIPNWALTISQLDIFFEGRLNIEL